jgi:gamma-glutamylcyclotransferase (GGCT)/AIG2-like uncharacterized protein YtfP
VTPRPLFVYGTLLDPRVLERQAGRRGLARRLRPARAEGWGRVALRGTPCPTLLRGAAAATEGALLRPGPAALARLSAYEGPSYRMVPVRVRTPGAGAGVCLARVWVTPRWRADAARPWEPPPRPGATRPRGRAPAAPPRSPRTAPAR